jgi:UDP-N-acetylmuramoyl-L-alanyl-D-glutamate--2,6-diaminopimelate ligase
MVLGDLLSNTSHVQWQKDFAGLDIRHLSCDSRESQAHGLFIALPGFKTDGAKHISQAIANGAVAVAVQPNSLSADLIIPANVAIVLADDPKIFLRQAALAFLGNPSLKVKTIGVTGTNGKTTITYLMESILNAAGSCIQD